MKNLKGFGICSVLVIIIFFQSCKKDGKKDPAGKTFYGQQTALGNGTMRSFVVVDADGTPKTIGIKFTAAALNGLPADTSVEHDTRVPLPAEAPKTGFDHLEVDWNPAGHEPKQIYGLPHFDFHFYMISAGEQETVIAGPDNIAVPEKFIPKDYVSGVMAVPDMGVHWFDSKAPEFSGETFTDTFIYGFYHGAMTFVEPMATSGFIATKPDFKIQIKQPAGFQKPGYYPTTQHLYYDEQAMEYSMALEGLVYAPGNK